MSSQQHEEPIVAEVWASLEQIYDNREERACVLAPEVGMTGSSLGRAIHEARDAHLSTFARVAKALGYRLQVELVPIDTTNERS